MVQTVRDTRLPLRFPIITPTEERNHRQDQAATGLPRELILKGSRATVTPLVSHPFTGKPPEVTPAKEATKAGQETKVRIDNPVGARLREFKTQWTRDA